MLRRLSLLLLLSSAFLFTLGCDEESTKKEGNQGFTACGDFPSGPVTCQPGQYCEDPIFSKCESGCLSNDNCSADQECVKTGGDNVGSCQNKVVSGCPATPCPDGTVCQDGTCVPVSTGSCADFCAKAVSCDPETDMTLCMAMCSAAPASCVSCVIGATCASLEDGICDTFCVVDINDCEDNSDCDGWYCNPAKVCVECLTSDHCTNGTCSAGVCVPDLDPGFTACGNFPAGPVTCQPGQYCEDAIFSNCESGCLSNLNCTTDQTCVKASGQNVGTCQGTTPTCDPACSGDTPHCLGTTCVECLNPSHCGNDETCTGNVCVPVSTGCIPACGTATPYCLNGTTCVECIDPSHCDPNETCVDNACVPAATGCVPACSGATPHCLNDTTCVQCINAGHCGANETCTNNACVPVSTGCTYTGFNIVDSEAYYWGPEDGADFVAYSTATPPGNVFGIEIWPGDGNHPSPMATGSYNLADAAELADCGNCMFLGRGCDEEDCDQIFVPVSGIVTYTELTSRFTGTLTNARFEEMGGTESWCITSLSFNAAYID